MGKCRSVMRGKTGNDANNNRKRKETRQSSRGRGVKISGERDKGERVKVHAQPMNGSREQSGGGVCRSPMGCL